MNENIDFWRVWTKNEKGWAFLASAFLLINISFLAYLAYQGQELVLSWDVQTELHEKLVSIPSYFFDDKVFSATQPVWYVKEKYLPAISMPSVGLYGWVLAMVMVGLSYILTVLQRLKGHWFLLGALVLGGALISFRLENVFLTNSNLPFLVAFIIGGGWYYAGNIFASRFKFSISLVVWLIFWLLLVGVCGYRGQINQPIVAISSYGLMFMLAIWAVFVFMTSHEALAGLVWLVSKNARKDQNSLNQYFLVSVILLLNALLVYLENARKIEASVYIFPPVFWFILQGVLGIWGFRKFCEQINWFSHRQSGFWLYIGFFLIASGAMILIYGSANSSLVELSDDFISIAFLALSLGFFVYVLINYFQLFKAGHAVHKVLYKSPFNRLVFSRTAAFFMILVLFSFKNYYSYYQLQAGLSNVFADFYRIEGDHKAAETYYKNSSHYEPQNLKGSLSLAALSTQYGDAINASFFYNQSLEKNPTPQAYIGLAQNLHATNMYFDAIFTLQKGIKKFPQSPELYTNLALMQSKANLPDSVLFNLIEASKYCKKCNTENSNLLAFWLENAKPDKLQEMSEAVAEKDYTSFHANKSAINRYLNLELPNQQIKFTADSLLDMATAAQLLNNALYARPSQNTHFVKASDLASLQKNNGNQAIFEELSLAFASQNFYRENKVSGLKQITLLRLSNSKYRNIYNQMAGLWYMQEGLVNKASALFQTAGDSTSASIIKNSDLVQKIDASLKTQAQKLTKELSLANYQQTVNKAPLNHYLLTNTADLLVKNNKKLEAYNLVFYATELNEESPVLWEKYIRLALGISQIEYAQDALVKIKPLVSDIKYKELSQDIEDYRKKTKEDTF